MPPREFFFSVQSAELTFGVYYTFKTFFFSPKLVYLNIYVYMYITFNRSRSAAPPHETLSLGRHCTRMYRAYTRAINLFKCHSEIISEHDRVPSEFKFVACARNSIFRRVPPVHMLYARVQCNVPQMVSTTRPPGTLLC